MTRSLRRLWIGLAALLLLLFLARPAAAASIDAVMSDVKSSSGTVTGVLTVRSANPVQVDPGSVKASVDGVIVKSFVSEMTHTKRTAMLVIDTSGSMGTDGMATVRAATRAYLKEAPEDVLIGVVTFANTAGVDLKPTVDRAAAQRVVNGLDARGDTSLYAAVRSAARAMPGDGDRSMVLLSDGADTVSDDRQGDLAEANRELKRRGVRVDVVRFNTDDPDAVVALRSFASASGGSVIPATNASDVGAAFKSAARALRSQAQFTLTPSSPLQGNHTITISGTAAGEPFKTTQTVNFGEVAAVMTPAAPPPAGPAGAALPPLHALTMQASLMPWIAAGTIGVAILLLAIGILTPSFATRREQRLASLESYMGQTRVASRSEGKHHSAPIAEQLVNFGERAMKGRSSTARTMELINRADLPLRPGEWWVLRSVAVLSGVAIGMLLFGGSALLGAALGFMLGYFLPAFVLRFLAARRAAAFERLLPQSLMLVSTSLRSGFGLPQALDSIAKDAPDPLAKEFSRGLAETRIGTDIADALERMADRMGSRSMRMAVMAIRIQREVGGNLAETLETTARTLRERESLHRQVRALSAEGRLSAYILIALPIGLFFYMMWVNYGYISLLWTHPLGLMMLVGGIVLLIGGIFWMRQVVKIEV
ncbi:type II secretion system F family protein [Intrasporangium calvum]|uniref:Type II secretion system F domain n=1 Tax=Intrasporangium calvum (strain ATCC 23552 / DSM 43043 / JCM 3097 / NBRC 12989 / NCIMB 10167 / NRRL B-3866 / 7 KIP) TaxID=710696 RepID=E6S8T2_INTC7|nr:type II secretion system F family protein [Intrasporangium calvum]ADU47051.1 Type II secretion system F domain [Intrasporangium calvum DSM 43043]